MRALLFLFFFLITLLFSLPFKISAADLNIDCLSFGSCTKSGVDPLFNLSLDGYWYPGKSSNRTINLKNSSGETREMVLSAERKSAQNILENVINIKISAVDDNSLVWKGKIADFYNQEKISFGNFNAGVSRDYNFAVSMDQSADNQYQNKETYFNLSLGFWSNPPTTPTPKEILESTPNTTPSEQTGETTTGATGSTTLTTVTNSSNLTIADNFTNLNPMNITPTGGEILGQTTQTSLMVGSLTCNNSWWGVILLLLQGSVSVKLVKNVNRNNLAKIITVNLSTTLVNISVFWAFFCWKILIFIPMIINISTFYGIYKRLKLAENLKLGI